MMKLCDINKYWVNFKHWVNNRISLCMVQNLNYLVQPLNIKQIYSNFLCFIYVPKGKILKGVS